MTALDDFWDALSLLLRPDDPAHNANLVHDFSAMSGISEEVVREKLQQAMQPDGARQ